MNECTFLFFIYPASARRRSRSRRTARSDKAHRSLVHAAQTTWYSTVRSPAENVLLSTSRDRAGLRAGRRYAPTAVVHDLRPFSAAAAAGVDTSTVAIPPVQADAPIVPRLNAERLRARMQRARDGERRKAPRKAGWKCAPRGTPGQAGDGDDDPRRGLAERSARR